MVFTDKMTLKQTQTKKDLHGRGNKKKKKDFSTAVSDISGLWLALQNKQRSYYVN